MQGSAIFAAHQGHVFVPVATLSYLDVFGGMFEYENFFKVEARLE